MFARFLTGGLYVVFRKRRDDRDALGFVIKRKSARIFSERYGGYRTAFSVGPLYFRTYARKPIVF